MPPLPQYRQDDQVIPERGAILVLSALIMLLLLVIAAFATDLGAWYRQGQEQQRAADVGSLNAIQGYDTRIKDYITNAGFETYGELSPAQKDDVEQLAIEAAVDALLGTLGASGIYVSSPVVYNPDPIVASTSVASATVTADDGTVITLTRNPNKEIVVTITQVGTQYFSNIIRSAPEITRSGVGVISNCNADCSREIQLDPPFAGFNAAGEGDGYRPMIGNNGRIWVVNHHATNSSNYEVVCMDRDTQSTCSGWAPLGLIYVTANKGDDTIDNVRNRIYFGAHRTSTDEFGIACVDTVSRGYCSGKEFTPLHNHNLSNYGENFLTGNGVWMVDDKLYAMGQDGQIHCVLPDNLGSGNPYCTGYPKSTALYGESFTPSLNADSRYLMGEIIGKKIYLYHQAEQGEAGGSFQCWDTQTETQCSNFSGYTRLTAFPTTRPVKFLRFDQTASGDPDGFCVGIQADTYSSFRHYCVSLNGILGGEMPNLRYNTITMNDTSALLHGEGFSIDGRRTVWGSLDNDHSGGKELFCYDWVAQNSCGELIGQQVYGMAKLSDDCIIGVGHSSQLTSINPTTMTTCTGTTVTTTVFPCDCSDGVEKRYGVLELPQGLTDVLNSANATVTGGSPELTITGNLLDGPLDLSPFNSIATSVAFPSVELEIAVDSKIDGSTGELLWTETYYASLALTVQPTLAR